MRYFIYQFNACLKYQVFIASYQCLCSCHPWQCLLSVSIRTYSPDREVKMSSCWIYLTPHWPVSLWAKMRLGSPLHMASLHIYCLKNMNLEAHYAWPASINMASKTRHWKPITHGQPSPHRSGSLSLQMRLQKLITHSQPLPHRPGSLSLQI